jgi:glycerophosphoryl diester phosphodiesterase
MVRVIAHRGASAAAPENTIEAFRLARELGADWVELDARRTLDGQVVVHHDAELADGSVIVRLARAQLPDHICDLADALDACEGMSINIEIKNWPEDPDFDATERVAEQVVELVQARSLHDRVLVSCFHRPTIDRVRQLDPGIATAFLFVVHDGDGWEPLAAEVAAGGHAALHPWDGFVDEAMVAAARAHGLEINVWTVDDPERMAQLIELGIDGLCTNVPDVARQVVDRAG